MARLKTFLFQASLPDIIIDPVISLPTFSESWDDFVTWITPKIHDGLID